LVIIKEVSDNINCDYFRQLSLYFYSYKDGYFCTLTNIDSRVEVDAVVLRAEGVLGVGGAVVRDDGADSVEGPKVQSVLSQLETIRVLKALNKTYVLKPFYNSNVLKPLHKSNVLKPQNKTIVILVLKP
jgi:hypothetical protein